MIGVNTSQMAITPLPNPTASMTAAASASLKDAGQDLRGAMRLPSASGPTA
jgi:hypothetical protein